MKKLILLFAFCFWCSTQIAAQNEAPKKAQFLGILKLEENYKTVAWTEKEINIVQAHFKRLTEMKDAGTVILAGRTQYENDHPDLTGLVIFYAANIEEAREWMLKDPAVVGKIMKSEVHPYQVALGCK